jgi:MFS family permease
VTARLRHTLRSLRHRNFRLFFAGQFISMTGTWMQSTAQLWLVYRLSKSPFLLGAVGFAGQAPAILLGLVGGWVADRFDRRTVVVVTQTAAMIQAFLLAALTLTGRVQVWHVAALAAMMGVINAFDMPARQSFVVRMVGAEDLPNAIALNSTLVNAARMLGPAAAGALVGVAGEGPCFLANAVSYVAVIVCLLLMRLEPDASRVPAGKGWGAQVREGVGYVAGHPGIRRVLLLLAVTCLAGVPFLVLLPIFADGVFHRGAHGLGFLTAAMGVGAMGGAVFLAAKKGSEGMGLAAGTGALVFGAALTAFSFSRHFGVSLSFMALAGGGMMTAFAAANTRLQSLTTDAMRGRVMSFFSMTFLGITPLGSLLAGTAAGRFGAPATVGVGGLVCAAAGGVFLAGRRARLKELSH